MTSRGIICEYLHSAFAHANFEHVADAQLIADPLHINRTASVGDARVAGITNSQRKCESAVMISSTIPAHLGPTRLRPASG